MRITITELLEFASKAYRLNYKYRIFKNNEDFWVILETEYGDKHTIINQDMECSPNHYSLEYLINFLDDKLKERLDTVERERKLQKLLQKLTPEEKELLGVS